MICERDYPAGILALALPDILMANNGPSQLL